MGNIIICIESQILCVISLVILLKLNSPQLRGAVKNTAIMGYITIFASFMDVLRAIFCENILLLHIFTVLYLCSFGFVGYFWLLYILERFSSGSLFAKRALIVPAVLVSFFVISSAETGWIYSFGEGGSFIKGKLFLALLANYIYVILSFFVIFSASKKC